jgi:hypothetical protein
MKQTINIQTAKEIITDNFQRQQASSTLLGFGLIHTPHYFTLERADFHPEMVSLLDNWAEQFLGIAGFRGCAKSTYAGLILPLYAALEGKAKFIVLINETEDVAKLTIANIREELEQNDLIKKLAAQKFIPVNTSDKKKIKFTNPLIGLYALSAEKSRELRSLESELGTQTDTLSQRQSAIGTNPDATDSLQNDVAYTQGKISDINSRIAKLKNEIVTLERNTRDKLKQMKDGLANNKKKLDYFIKTK